MSDQGKAHDLTQDAQTAGPGKAKYLGASVLGKAQDLTQGAHGRAKDLGAGDLAKRSAGKARAEGAPKAPLARGARRQAPILREVQALPRALQAKAAAPKFSYPEAARLRDLPLHTNPQAAAALGASRMGSLAHHSIEACPLHHRLSFSAHFLRV